MSMRRFFSPPPPTFLTVLLLLVLFVVAIVGALSLKWSGGSDLRSSAEGIASPPPQATSAALVRIWTDVETGCDYLVVPRYTAMRGRSTSEAGTAIMPRMRADGQQWCVAR